MINQKLPNFLPVAPGQKAILKVPRFSMTLTRIQLKLAGTFTKAQCTEIWVKIGSRAIWETTGADLDRMNNYKGLFADAFHLTIDFTERDAEDIIGKEIGGIDLGKLADDLYIEVMISGAAVAPQLSAIAFLTPPQGDDKDPAQLIKKLVRVTTPSLPSGRQDINFSAQGALIQRCYINYTGTDWTTSADGNLRDLRVKKNGIPILDDINCFEARFMQQEYRKVPQSRMYVWDAIVDNNQSGAVVTADAKSLQIQPLLNAGDTLTCYFEMLDKPYNV